MQRFVLLLSVFGLWCCQDPATAADVKTLAERIRQVDSRVFSAERDELQPMLREDMQRRLRQANRRDLQSWRQVETRGDWQALRDPRLKALRQSLGSFPSAPEDLPVRITGEIEGDGYVIENILFESREDLWVTANLYRPAEPHQSMPGILICHSHHNPKTQDELQAMGMSWARQGCVVLVMDQLGHGERRQHPFRTAEDYPEPFRVGRQDYYFRYNTGMQLHLIGDSLMGWMVWDLRRGVDLLLSRAGVDEDRIILLGSVAGGGDPAAVTAALDHRIDAAVPFNFGGPQPYMYPLPDNPETEFRYTGGPSWESTRNLRLSARDGFLPWVIVGAIAPRRLLYAHEFTWNRSKDPVWPRLEKIWSFYGHRARLSFAHGYGYLRGSSLPASHCNNIGRVHRKMIYPVFRRWFDMPIPEEYRKEWPDAKLLCLDGADDVELTPVHQLADRLAARRMRAFRKQLEEMNRAKRRQFVADAWENRLGDMEPYSAELVEQREQRGDDLRQIRFVLEGERAIRVPVLLLLPGEESTQHPVVVGVAQAGKRAFLKHRSRTIAALLQAGIGVCLPDLRGTGETRPGDGRGRRSAATDISSGELMLGQTLLGSRLKDLRTVLAVLRRRADVEKAGIALWGDSFAKINPPARRLDVPLRISERPNQSEPLGHLLALLGGLFEEEVAAIASRRGGLLGFRSALGSRFLYLPHDVVVPEALTAGDLADMAAAVAPRPLWVSGLVDGLNRAANMADVKEAYTPARKAYQSAQAGRRFHLSPSSPSADRFAEWLSEHVQ